MANGMLDDSLLNEVFRFPHKRPSASQEARVCAHLADNFGLFLWECLSVEFTSRSSSNCSTFERSVVDPLVDDRSVSLDAIASTESQALSRISRILGHGTEEDTSPKTRGDIWVERWLPKYGCVLQMEQTSVASIALRLVFPDAWQHAVHFLPDGECVHSAVPTSHGVLNCGDVHPKLKDQVMKSFDKELKEAQSRTGSDRSAAGGAIGHQKTPQFIAALLARARSAVSAASKSPTVARPQALNSIAVRGGTTDVGLHTGGSYRDTCWPLVQAVIGQNLPGHGVLFDKIIMLYQLHLVELKVKDVEQLSVTSTKLWGSVEDAFAMLQKVVLRIVELVQRGYSAGKVEARCSKIRRRIMNSIERANSAGAKQFRLPDGSELRAISASMVYPQKPKLPHVDYFVRSDDTFDVVAHAHEQISSVDFVNPETCSPAAFVAWLSHTVDRGWRATLIVLRAIEAFLFRQTTLLRESTEAPPVACTIAELQSILAVYEYRVTMWNAEPLCTSLLDVEQQSLDLLVKWIGFCLVHRLVAKSHKLLTRYGIALKWQDLSVAVLKGKAAMDALRVVAAYIRAWNQSRAVAIFDLCNHAPTIEFARAFARDSASHRALYAMEKRNVEGRVASSWNVVLAKRQDAAALRIEIASIEERIGENEELLEEEEADLAATNRALPRHLRQHETKEIRQYRHQIRTGHAMLGKRQRILETTLRVPQFTKSPLPEDEMSALETLFFLDMPSDIACLGDLCAVAQHALASRGSPFVATALKESVSKPTWWSHFQKYGVGRHPSSTLFTACSSSFSEPYSFGPATIESLDTIADFARRCVWYPPSGTSGFFWKHSGASAVNPFKITRKMMTEWFTHQLPPNLRSLQWAVAHPGGAERGNLVYSKLYEWYPGEFDRHAFIQFGQLRAFPYQQVRKICCALVEGVLPWHHTCVIAAVRQAMFEVGELTNEAAPKLLWKSDIESDEGLAHFCSALDRLVSKLARSPRSFEDVPLLSELTGFAAQRSQHARDIVSKLVDVCLRWASDVREQYQNHTSMASQLVRDLRSKESLLYGYAIQCYALGEVRDEDLLKLGKLVLLFRNSMLYSSGSTLWPELQRLDIQVADTMSRRINALVAFVMRSSTSITLTLWLQAVNLRAPGGLNWTVVRADRQGDTCSSFMAHHEATKTHFAVNLFTGSVLTDGNTPGGIPAEIRADQRYRTLFEDQDFEVSCSKGVYRTSYAIDGAFWEFSVVGSEVHIRQVFLNSKKEIVKRLELCPASFMRTLTNVLPARVMQMHSLWYWVECHCILARPPTAFATEVAFIVAFYAKQDGILRIKCFQVPMTDKKAPHDTIVYGRSQYDRFVTISGRLVTILEKFEDRAFIHTLRTRTGGLKIHLPRFRLTFSLDAARGLLCSKEYEGYVLDESQQFTDAFPNFSRYLVLRLSDTGSSIAKPLVKILAPAGEVVKEPDGRTSISVSASASAQLDIVAFDVHRRFNSLVTETITARLQLCAILVSTGSIVPSSFLKMTGAEAALKAMRGCYVSRPLSHREKQSLLSVCKFGHREPALRIMGVDSEIDCSNELDAYYAMCVQRPERNALRVRLDDVEENAVLGSVLQRELQAKRVTAERLVDVDSPPTTTQRVREIEDTLRGCLALDSQSADQVIPPLPVKQLEDDIMGGDMNAELYESWRAYHTNPEARLAADPLALLPAFQELLITARSLRSSQEVYLFRCITSERKGDVCRRLLALTNYVPTATVEDIVRSSVDEKVMLLLAPYLTQPGRVTFQNAVRVFMELCVLEDKLERLVQSAQRDALPSSAFFVDELVSVREWKSAEHPYWLAFEVEGRLQIRHEQYVVAKHLIENPGSVCQMNMGRGKTRVILPMLFLYYSHRSRGDRIARAHFLTPLLSETREFMHRYLSASSILQLNFVEQPFHRDVELSLEQLSLLEEVIDEAKASGKFMIVAPEHRMSLELKRLDIVAAKQARVKSDDEAGEDEKEDDEDEEEDDDKNDTMIDSLDSILDQGQFIDVLDECDAILHHKYHLVYAVGVPQKLSSGDTRWIAVEVLLRVINSDAGSRVGRILSRSHVALRSSEYDTRLGGFTGLRLNASVENKELHRADFRRALVLDLGESSSFSMSWLRTFFQNGDKCREQIVQAITDPTMSVDVALAGLDHIVANYRDRILALRGLIAFGILEHCLEKRHRVEYGLPDAKTRKKRMAIPFHAADIPSERSEFSHPEVGITLTVLAYYHKGLDQGELREALQKLMKLGVSDQSETYKKWFDAVKAKVNPEVLTDLPSDAPQLSPKDARQFALLFDTFRFTTETINFFVNTCVFPSDTTQYPHRLSRSAWNLAGGDWNIGFSGTNDNHRLLPLSVTQREPRLPSLLGTNGRMVDRIIQVNCGYEVIWTSELEVTTPWQALLRLAMDKQTHALIDTGALLAGVLNNDAAAYLLELDGFAFAGVTYYDTRSHLDCWVVLDAASKHVTALKKATTLEKDTFVIFDDARSRGSDMKLLPDAVAVLTLGPKLTKDKLMQGAGRMRQLGCNQTLWLASLDEVAQSILQVCGKADVASVDTADVLDWVMENTKSEAVHGLVEWASSGLHFSKTRDDPDAELVDEDWRLDSLYSHAHHPELISDIVRSKMQAMFASESGEEDRDVDSLVAAITERSMKYGVDDHVLVSSHNEECERELHIEQFEEQIREREEESLTPTKEVVWEYSCLLTAKSVTDLVGVVTLTKLASFVQSRLAPGELRKVQWDTARLFGTSNFFSTVMVAPADRMNYLSRLADAFLVFRDGTALLLSDYEADQVLQLCWSNRKRQVDFCFLNVTLAVQARDELHPDPAAAARVSWTLGNPNCAVKSQCAVVATTCQLFNGETMFANCKESAVRSVLKTVLSLVPERESVFKEFAASRGQILKWPRSFLHKLSHEMDLADLARH